VANDHDFVVILSTAREEDRGESAYIKMLQAQRVDGVILASAALFDRHVMELAVSGYPFVFLGRYPLNQNITAVGVDDIGGADMLTSHLVMHGYRSIVHITGPLDHLSAADRRDGFRRALGRAGIAAREEDLIEGDYSEASGRAVAQQLLQRPTLPQAIFAGNDEMAYGVLDVFRERGLRIPEDVALVGFDDLAIARVMSPALTTVRQPIVQLGATAAERLIALVEHQEVPETQTILPVTLSIRDSCGPETM
jgi:DNA-binding LacI/PurR family transcriptional regulator